MDIVTIKDIFIIFIQSGFFIIFVKFLIDRMLSNTTIEIDLENNYNKAFRVFINYVVFIIIILFLTIFISFLIYNYFENKEMNDAVVRGHYKIIEADYLKVKKESEKKAIIAGISAIILLISLGYFQVRDFWVKNYKRRTYIIFEEYKLFIVKKLDRENILFSDELKTKYRILSFIEIQNYYFYTESIKERSEVRQLEYYNDFKNRMKWKDIFKKNTLLEKCLIVIGVSLLVILFVFLIIPNPIINTSFMAIIIVLVLAYRKKQIDNGRKINKRNRKRNR